MKASELDERFESGGSVLEFFDLSKAKRINEEPKRVNINFPSWMVEMVDKEAHHIGVSRQAIIKMWIAEKLKVSNQVINKK